MKIITTLLTCLFLLSPAFVFANTKQKMYVSIHNQTDAPLSIKGNGKNSTTIVRINGTSSSQTDVINGKSVQIEISTNQKARSQGFITILRGTTEVAKLECHMIRKNGNWKRDCTIKSISSKIDLKREGSRNDGKNINYNISGSFNMRM